jgi:hypothetical protein
MCKHNLGKVVITDSASAIVSGLPECSCIKRLYLVSYQYIQPGRNVGRMMFGYISGNSTYNTMWVIVGDCYVLVQNFPNVPDSARNKPSCIKYNNDSASVFVYGTLV